MYNYNKYNKKVNFGFSLIELMVVVAIIGILASIATPIYINYTIKSKVSYAVSILEGLKSKVIEYYTENNNFPISNATTTSLGFTSINYSDNIISGITATSSSTFPKAGSSSISGAIGYIEATFVSSGDKVPVQLQGKSIALVAKDNGPTIGWECASSSISVSFHLPNNCQ